MTDLPDAPLAMPVQKLEAEFSLTKNLLQILQTVLYSKSKT